MKRPIDKWCAVCAAAPGQLCAAADGNGVDMPNQTHAIPKDNRLPTDKLSRDTDAYAIAELTVRRVLDVTRPKGMEARTWAELVGQASQADRGWDKHEGIADPWAEGSVGWQEFAPQIADTRSGTCTGRLDQTGRNTG